MEDQGDFLNRQTSSILESGLSPHLTRKEPDPVFFDQFSARCGEVIRHLAVDIPLTQTTASVSREGRTGILPHPAKAVVAREVLSGRPISPLKISEEDIPSGSPERSISSVTFHAVADINPLTVVDNREITAIAETLLSLGKFINRENAVFELGEESLKVQNFKVVIHFLTRSITGKYQLRNLPLKSLTDLRTAMFILQESLKGVLKPDQDTLPNTDLAARQILGAQIAKDTLSDQDQKEGHLSIPIVICPKSYYSFHLYSNGTEAIPQNCPSIVIEKNNSMKVCTQEEDKYGVRHLKEAADITADID